MYMGKIEIPAVVAEPSSTVRGSLALGLVMLAVAIPLTLLRLLVHFLVRDIRLVGRAARVYAACFVAARADR